MTDEQANASSQKSGGGTLKTIIIVAIVMLIEGAAIMGTMMLSGGPASAEGSGLSKEEIEKNKVIEVLVIKDKFHNRLAGVTYLYDTEIYITTRNKYSEKVDKVITDSKASLTVDVGNVFRQAEPAVFREPTYATLSRQIKAVLDKRFGTGDADESIVQDVLILKCIGYRAEG